jgi:hypothetical protein
MVMKFLRDLDILRPLMCRWPVCRKYRGHCPSSLPVTMKYVHEKGVDRASTRSQTQTHRYRDTHTQKKKRCNYRYRILEKRESPHAEGERTRRGSQALENFVLVVRELQVDATGVHVQRLPEDRPSAVNAKH